MERKKERKVFSEDFKREKVRQIESGLITAPQLAKMLNILPNPIYEWKKKYGTTPASERIVFETESDYLKFVASQKENQNLLQLIGKQQIKLDYYITLVKEANSHFNLDIENLFKKK